MAGTNLLPPLVSLGVVFLQWDARKTCSPWARWADTKSNLPPMSVGSWLQEVLALQSRRAHVVATAGRSRLPLDRSAGHPPQDQSRSRVREPGHSQREFSQLRRPYGDRTVPGRRRQATRTSVDGLSAGLDSLGEDGPASATSFTWPRRRRCDATRPSSCEKRPAKRWAQVPSTPMSSGLASRSWREERIG